MDYLAVLAHLGSDTVLVVQESSTTKKRPMNSPLAKISFRFTNPS